MDNFAGNLGDLTAFGAILGSYLQFLPEIAALLAIVWTLIRIYEWFRFRIRGIKNVEDKFL